MRTNAELLQSKIERVARIISDRYGIRVVFSGDQCKTDGMTIYLPAIPVLPDDADEATRADYEELMGALEGYADHEAAHLIWTNWAVLEKTKVKDKPRLKLWLNLVEDVRIEARMAETWKGCGENFAKADRYIHRKHAREWGKLNDTMKVVLVASAMARDDLGILDEFKGAAAEELKEKVELLEPLTPVFRMAKDRDDTFGALALAAWIDARISGEEIPDVGGLGLSPDDEKKMMEALRELEDEIRDAVSGRKGSPKKVKGESKAKDELAGDDYSGAEEATSIEEAYEEGEEEKGEEDKGKGEEGKEEGESKGDEEKFGSEFGAARTILDVDPSEAAKADKRRSLSPGEAIRGGVAEFKKYRLTGIDFYVPYTTEGDKVTVMAMGSKAWFRKKVDDIQKTTGVMVRRLRRLLLSQKDNCWQYDKESGKLNPRAMPRLLLTGQPRVFKQLSRSQAVNARISLIVDQSGSMGGRRISAARDSAIMFGEFCDKLDIPFEISGFSASHEIDQKRFDAATPEDRKLYSRWGDLWLYMYKQYGEEWRKVGPRLQGMDSICHNMDGESIELAGKRLLASAKKGERLIMFVFSDGMPVQEISEVQPQQQWYLGDVVKRLTKAGVTVVGVGIQTDHVKHFYPSWVVINDPSSLAAANVDKIGELLLPERLRKEKSEAS